MCPNKDLKFIWILHVCNWVWERNVTIRTVVYWCISTLFLQECAKELDQWCLIIVVRQVLFRILQDDEDDDEMVLPDDAAMYDGDYVDSEDDDYVCSEDGGDDEEEDNWSSVAVGDLLYSHNFYAQMSFVSHRSHFLNWYPCLYLKTVLYRTTSTNNRFTLSDLHLTANDLCTLWKQINFVSFSLQILNHGCSWHLMDLCDY